MNYLIVEDENNKFKEIQSVIELGSIIHRACDAKLAINILKKYVFDVVILDMTLPYSRDNSRLNTLAGKELLFDMQSENIIVPTIVVTRYLSFGTETIQSNSQSHFSDCLINNHFNKEGIIEEFEEYTGSITSFRSLHKYLITQIPFYLGIVFFTQQNDKWKTNLRFLLEGIKSDGSFTYGK